MRLYFKPLKDSTIGELALNLDIVLGNTASEDDQGKMRGIGIPDLERRKRRQGKK